MVDQSSLFDRISSMHQSLLKDRLLHCMNSLDDPFKPSDFSIGHRGAPRFFPEHTLESYQAAAQMGAGIIECDVTFTRDKELVCRHSQCDLHTTTNILKTALAEKCTEPFQPAVVDADGNLLTSATAQCCASDITLAEFKSLKGRMDGNNPQATSVAGYLPDGVEEGTLMSHQESIALFQRLKVKMIPELKAPGVPMPFDGFSRENYARKIVDEYRQAEVPASDVWLQSFNLDDVLYWISHEPEFADQVVYLDGRYSDPAFDHRDPATWSPSMAQLAGYGVKIIAPPIWMLLEVMDGEIVPSYYAHEAKAAGLKLITWTLNRGPSPQQGINWYFQTLNGRNPHPSSPSAVNVIHTEGDSFAVLHALTEDVGILGIFSDWPAAVSFYANCMGFK